MKRQEGYKTNLEFGFQCSLNKGIREEDQGNWGILYDDMVKSSGIEKTQDEKPKIVILDSVRSLLQNLASWCPMICLIIYYL